ncbi:hypothetical protein [Actinoplanes lobatus]|uniref:Uncharacterized protein n=1 Tax=Actinoplanes lobatus TaxID=113568 RepID=A0A7W7HRE3_9ACTN|nr:hypothetical protein [Actinoplanes lobatus]MBB4755316.1 hypothetical protein [Actinoplanes lobatus]GIE46187.1 hypothetical protein Alo02nite_90850 [Actinoplanes lobatus]
MTTPDYLAAVALELSHRVREDDPEANGRWLAKRLPEPGDWFRLAFVLAAALPQDRPWRELTGWAADLTEWTGPRPEPPDESPALQPCGTRAAYRRHRRRGEDTCQPCRDAAARYKRGERCTNTMQDARRPA